MNFNSNVDSHLGTNRADFACVKVNFPKNSTKSCKIPQIYLKSGNSRILVKARIKIAGLIYGDFSTYKSSGNLCNDRNRSLLDKIVQTSCK